MNLKGYIERIKYKGELTVNERSLRQLHKSHVSSVPFEALDVYYRKRISLDIHEIYHKVVDQKRGGYCYEVNYLFLWLLLELGFDSHLISARIIDDDKYGPEYDHMAILVQLNEDWLVDVGYGDLFIEPIKLIPDIEQEDKFKTYKIHKKNNDEFLLLESLKESCDYKIKYLFNTRSCSIKEFELQNEVKQNSFDSYFVKNRICTLPTEEGRKTILNDIYKVRTNNTAIEKEISTEKELCRILEIEFDISLGELELN